MSQKLMDLTDLYLVQNEFFGNDRFMQRQEKLIGYNLVISVLYPKFVTDKLCRGKTGPPRGGSRGSNLPQNLEA